MNVIVIPACVIIWLFYITAKKWRKFGLKNTGVLQLLFYTSPRQPNPPENFFVNFLHSSVYLELYKSDNKMFTEMKKRLFACFRATLSCFLKIYWYKLSFFLKHYSRLNSPEKGLIFNKEDNRSAFRSKLKKTNILLREHLQNFFYLESHCFFYFDHF